MVQDPLYVPSPFKPITKLKQYRLKAEASPVHTETATDANAVLI